MEKNVSINIHGIVFHVEESGYDILREYLDSIHAYFSSFENSSEIIADIEDRIAELFTAKTKGTKTAITQEDVQRVIEKMGRVNDFKVDDSDHRAEEKTSEQQPKESSGKKLYRDKNRALAGGVCAGIAHYFSIDPVWPRILFLILAISSFGTLALIYVLFWIVMPASNNLDEQEDVVKMFRNSENKVIGGVASGLATFLGVDVVLIRVLFVASVVFAGSGVILYIVLWIILPEAKSMTDKMQMHGKSITLSNIEATIKKKVSDEKEPENTLTKILLFPFRLIAIIIGFLSKILTLIFTLVIGLLRVGIGGIAVLLGFLLLSIFFFSSGIGLGLIHITSLWNWGVGENVSLPIDALISTFPIWFLIPILIAPLIILIFLLLLGISLLGKGTVFKPLVWWVLFIILLIDIATLGFILPSFVAPFTKSGTYQETSRYMWPDTTPSFKMHDTGLEDYDVTSINLIGYQDSVVKVVKNFKARGNTSTVAKKNAQMITYQLQQKGNIFVFDSNIAFKEGAIFRAQRLEVDIYVPFNRTFKIDPDLLHIINNQPPTQDEHCTENEWKISATGMECTASQEDAMHKE